MFEITAENAVDYLKGLGLMADDGTARVSVLTGGVSNFVLLVEPKSGPPFVLKQARPQLRTRAAWFSRLERILREIDMMRHLKDVLPIGAIPRLLFADRDNYAYGMEAVARDHVVWKSELLAGRFDRDIAGRLGGMLAAIHHAPTSPELRHRLGDREFFDELRIDPYYRRIAKTHPDVQPAIARLIREMADTAVGPVHADFSPKNVLVTRREGSPTGVTLVDFETGHWGDPAFDFGFFLTHLLLKGVYHHRQVNELIGLADVFLDRYWDACPPDAPAALQRAELERRSVPHVAACMLARVDGKSPVDYLTDPDKQEFVRAISRDGLLDPPPTFAEFFDRVREGIASRSERVSR